MKTYIHAYIHTCMHTYVAPDLVSPGVICLAGGWCLDWLSWRMPRFGQSTCAELCGGAVLSWIFWREKTYVEALTQRVYQSMNQSIYLILHNSIQCYIYTLWYSKYDSTHTGVVPKINNICQVAQPINSNITHLHMHEHLSTSQLHRNTNV